MGGFCGEYSLLWCSLDTLLRHWILLILLPCVLDFGLGGWFARGLGVLNLFHDDKAMIDRFRKTDGWEVYRNSASLFSQLGLSVFFALAWSYAYALNHIEQPEMFPIERMSADVAVQAGVYSVVSLIIAASHGLPKGQEAPGHINRRIIGMLLGVIIGWVFTFLIETLALTAPGPLGLFEEHYAPVIASVGLSIVLFLYIIWQRRLLPVISMIGLIGGGAALYTALAALPGAMRLVAVLVIGVLIVLRNGGLSKTPMLKFEIPGLRNDAGLDPYPYANRLKLKEFYAHPPRKPTMTGVFVTPEVALKNAAARSREAGGPEKPRLFMVATSGGAYRASFWTAMVLDRLAKMDRAGETPGLCRNVRLITGASGGMVGAAYFAVEAVDGPPPREITALIEEDVERAQFIHSGVDYPYKTRFPAPRDSLSPVAQQLLQSDLPGLISSAVSRRDRGTVLEDQWGTIDVSFCDLLEAEQAGRRPSLLFSPMIVESGQPLLISNLDLKWMFKDDKYDPEAVALFDWFPKAHDSFRVKTAVRLNASFPYISPAASLPTIQERRVVDAGYYDNYGIDLAVTYLSDAGIRKTIAEHYSGVTILEIRAFPFASPSEDQIGGAARAFQFLSTPLDGALSARGSTMTFRNRQSFDRLQARIEAEFGEGFLDMASFELNPAQLAGNANPNGTARDDISLNWYLTAFEKGLMARCLDEDDRVAEAFRQVRRHFGAQPTA